MNPYPINIHSIPMNLPSDHEKITSPKNIPMKTHGMFDLHGVGLAPIPRSTVGRGVRLPGTTHRPTWGPSPTTVEKPWGNGKIMEFSCGKSEKPHFFPICLDDIMENNRIYIYIYIMGKVDFWQWKLWRILAISRDIRWLGSSIHWRQFTGFYSVPMVDLPLRDWD